ncbi:MAG: hypothetical protein ABL957_12120 [Parvularculaceae bacterium]
MRMVSRRDIKRVKRLAFETLDPKCDPATRKAAESLRRRVARWSKESPDFVGVGVAEQTTKGQKKGAPALKVYVRKKRARNRVPKSRLAPRFLTVAGARIPIDVEEIGNPRTEVEYYTHERRRPVGPGLGIGRKDEAWGFGTFGCLVRSTDASDRSVYLLSCAHVLAANGLGRNGDPIYQPAPEGTRRLADNIIARLARYQPFDFSTPDFPHAIDAAIARLEPGVARSNLIPYYGAIGPPKTSQPKQVRMFGAATGARVGDVLDPHFYGDIEFDHPQGGRRKLRFENIVYCTKYSDNGDSGAVVLDAEDGGLVGLHFAGSESASFYIRIGAIFSILQVELWRP